MNPNVYITGFGTFPGVPHNPCIDLINRLRILPPIDIDCILQILPVSYQRSIDEMEQLLPIIPEGTPRIHLGCSSKATGIVLECRSTNLRHSKCPDVDGVLYEEPEVITEKDELYLYTADIELHQVLVENVFTYISEDVAHVPVNLYWSSLRTSKCLRYLHVPIVFGADLNPIEAGLRLIIEQLLTARDITGYLVNSVKRRCLQPYNPNGFINQSLFLDKFLPSKN